MSMAMAMAARRSHFAVLFCLAILLHAAAVAEVPAAVYHHVTTTTSRRTGWTTPTIFPRAPSPPFPPPSTTTPAGSGAASRRHGCLSAGTGGYRRRGGISDDCFQLPHATCAVYPYDGETRTVDRASPVGGQRAAFLNPLCAAAGSCERNLSAFYGQCQGRWGDPLRAYCVTTSLEAQKGGKWRLLPVEPPIADPDAAATGGRACYVELAHLNYREGYYIRCPAFNCSHLPHVACTEFPPSAVAAAVWEHRRTTYRDTVGPLFGRFTYDA